MKLVLASKAEEGQLNFPGRGKAPGPLLRGATGVACLKGAQPTNQPAKSCLTPRGARPSTGTLTCGQTEEGKSLIISIPAKIGQNYKHLLTK